MFSSSMIWACGGFVAGWFLKDAFRKKDAPLVAEVKKLMREQEKKSSVVDVDAELKKLRS